MTSWRDDIRVVIGLDFGTTYSGFAYCHISDTSEENIYTNDKWPAGEVNLKTNTVLQYDSDFINVIEWGNSALSKQPNRRNKNETRPVELFKLHFGDLQDSLKPNLPVEFRKAVTDYLCEIGNLIKETIIMRWPGINFTENVLLVLAVPAEYSEKDKAIMRECVFNAKLINIKDSLNLQFTTEPEAAAIYCMKNKLQEYDLFNIGMTFMIVDCGGGTVDLTTRKLIGTKPLQLGEVTERIGDFCGSTFIDNEFIKFLREKLGTRAIDLLIENHYGQFQYIVQDFCKHVKIPFTGDNTKFHYELEIDENAPILLQYVSEETREIMEEKEWLIDIKYDDVKKMFDPIIDRIIRMIYIQLSNSLETSAMFIVGGFSESIYLQKRIKEEFQHKMNNILVPTNPVAAIVRGATMYGLGLKNSDNTDKMNDLMVMISTRVLKFTYGFKILSKWQEDYPPHRKVYEDRIYLFRCLVKRGTEVKVDQKFSSNGHKPAFPEQAGLTFYVYKTPEYYATYCDEPGMELVGILQIDLPDVHLGCERPVTFEFSFGQMEISVFAKNELNGQNFQTKFDILDDP